MVVRLANTGNATRVTVRLVDDAASSTAAANFINAVEASLWIMTNPDEYAANLPSAPNRVSPVKSVVDATKPIMMPRNSVAALVVVKAATKLQEGVHVVV